MNRMVCLVAVLIFALLSVPAAATQIQIVPGNASTNVSNKGTLTTDGTSDTSVATSEIVTPVTALTQTEITALGSNDGATSFVDSAGSAGNDEWVGTNMTLNNVQSVNWVKITFSSRTVNGARDAIRDGVYNWTTNRWITVASNPATSTFTTLTYNISSAGDKTAYLQLTGNTLKISLLAWGMGSSSDSVDVSYISATVDYVATTPPTYNPPTPTNIANTTGQFYVNHTVQAGAGNATNIFNKSVKINSGSLSWTNDSNPYKNTSGSAGDKINTTFCAFNNTNGGTLNNNCLWQNTTISSTPPTDTSFTVTIPAGESQSDGMFFNATNKSSKNVSARGQNSTSGYVNVTNTGNVIEKFFVNLTGLLPSGVSLKADTDSNPLGATVLSTTLVQIIASLGVGTSQSIWYWADYTNALPMNNKTLSTRVNSST